MKAIFWLLIFAAALFARAPSAGETVFVELNSGIRQKAIFSGFSGDTVLLGGYIKNEFTIVRLPKSSFKAVTSEAGETLSLGEVQTNVPLIYSKPAKAEEAGDSATAEGAAVIPLKPAQATDSITGASADEVLAAPDSTKDSLANTQPPADSLTAVSDSTAGDSLSGTPPSAEEPGSAPRGGSYAGKTLVMPLARRPIDSAFAASLDALLLPLLREEGKKPELVGDQACTEPACALSIARSEGAEGALFGSVSPSEGDSLKIELTYFSASENDLEEAAFMVGARRPLAGALESAALQTAVQKILGKLADPAADTAEAAEETGPARHYVYVDTEPDDAILAFANGDAICRTPCTFSTEDTGSVDLYAYWEVDNHIWAATSRTRVLQGDTAKLLLHLKKIEPRVQLVTRPENAEIYREEDSTAFFARPLGETPKILKSKQLGEAALLLKKEGYRDTTIQFYVMPTDQNKVEVELTKLTDEGELSAQRKARRTRTKRTVGIILMGSSVAPAVAGGIFAYLAHKEYEKARDLRDELSDPHVAGGENYEKKKAANKRHADNGDERTVASIVSFSVAAGLLAAGIVITF